MFSRKEIGSCIADTLGLIGLAALVFLVVCAAVAFGHIVYVEVFK